MNLLFQLIALVFALTVHEFCHALMGRYLGDRTAEHEGRLSLNPLSHIDPYTTVLLPLGLMLLGSPVVFAAAKPVPFNPWAVRGGRWGAALVALAGPASNLALAVLFAVWHQIMPVGLVSGEFFRAMVAVNVGLFVFNMIPFPPLDGSRLLYAVAPEGLRDVMDRIEQAGMLLLFVIMFFGYGYVAPFVARITTIIMSLLYPSGVLP